MKNLNLGCGAKFHPGWINVDMYAVDESVIECNFLNGIPFDDNYFDVVYHSHVLEHFPPDKGEILIRECFRILNPGGIIRIAFPDLEKIIHEYTRHMERLDNNQDAESDYDWIMLELFDQTVRNQSGGQMINYMNDINIKNKEYVTYRIGENTEILQHPKVSLFSIIGEFNKLKKYIEVKEGRNRLIRKIIDKLKEKKDKLLISILSKKEKNALAIGRFRKKGEIHQWMYDRYSIQRLLEKCGFTGLKIRTAEESYINDWSGFNLDNPQEHASLFVEAIKPL